MNKYIDMRKYGLSDHFVNLSEEFKGLTISRIISQEKGLYNIVTEQGEKLAEVSGKFRYNTHSLSDFPAVGDFAMVKWNENGAHAIIHYVLPRKSCFIRKAVGNIKQEQVVASNIDTIFLCMALNNDFNLRRLERYLSIAWDSRAIPVIVLTKSDLCNDINSRLSEVYSVAVGVDVVITTTIKESGYDKLHPFLIKEKTIAFIGSSGVGKSTLINCMIGENRLTTNQIRNDDKGRHTTTRRESILLPNGSMVIDTPGMRELGMCENNVGVNKTFEDIEKITLQCRFRNCTHSVEPNCAILEALERGDLQLERWQSYKKLMLESTYAEDKESYLILKEKKNKEISKLIKKLPVKNK